MPYRNPDNRRSTERYPVRVEARIRVAKDRDDETAWTTGHVLSISISGIFIASAQAFRPGDAVEIEIPFPDGLERLHGDVRWSSDGTPCGAGVAFRDLSEDRRHQIREASASGFWLHPTLSSSQTPENAEDLDYFDTDPHDLIDGIS